MTNASEHAASVDEELTAYLDGELAADAAAALAARLEADATLRDRLEFLRRGRPPAAAFDLVLAMAPDDRLAALLDAAERAPTTRRNSFGAIRAVAAAIMLVAAVGMGYGVARLTAPVEVAETHTWRDVVAEYVSLYTPETFALAPSDPAAYAPRLAQVGEGLGLDLTPEAVALPDLSLRGAALFHYDGKPLGQVVYLSTDHGPIAFCIIRNGRPDAPPAFEEKEGLNVVFWNTGGLGYLVIGTPPQATLEAMAETLSARVS
jgi:anti-sigma factor RsiW